MEHGAPGATDAERAAWLADKIGALGDYAKEAAAMLRRWPAGVKVSRVGDDGWARMVEILLESALSEENPAEQRKAVQRAYAAVMAARSYGVEAAPAPEPIGYVDQQRLRNLRTGRELSITLVAASEADLREGGDVPVYLAAGVIPA